MLTSAHTMLWRFAREKTGLAAVEFAFVMPVMLTFFLGLVEAGQALSCRADVTNMAATGADLIAQESAVDDTDMTNVFNALNAMLFPFDSTQASITIYSIVDNGTPAGKVRHSCTKSGSNAVNGPTTPPAGSTGGTIIAAANNGAYGSSGSVILATVSYTYSWSASNIFIGTQTWSNVFYSKPRNVAEITSWTC